MDNLQNLTNTEREKENLPLSEKTIQNAPLLAPEEEYRRLQELRSGGRYVPPAKLRALLEQINFQKGSREVQKLEWEKLKKAINGLVNKANTSNIKTIVVGLFRLNLNRGQGLFVRSVMKGQSLALAFTNVYASLVAVINSKLPHIGNLLISRLVLQFKKAYKRNNKELCLSSTIFLAHLINHQVAHEILALEILHLLLNNPTDDSIEVAINFIKNIGLLLTEVCPKALSDIFESLRQLLQERNLEKRTQYMIEVLFNVRRDGYKEFPIISEGLDLVEEEDQVVHTIHLTDKLKAQDNLSVFQFDEHYEKHEEEYNLIRIDILGHDHEEEEEEAEEEEEENESGGSDREAKGADDIILNSAENDSMVDIQIKDMTETNKTNFRKNIYLILKGSMSPDEAVHKILKLRIRAEDQELAVDTIVKASSQETTYSKYYGVSGEKLASQSKTWNEAFNHVFQENYDTIHRYESNPLRNVSKFWGHLLSSDALDWKVLSHIKLTEQDTSSAGRIFIKFLFQELVEELGIPELIKRLSDPEYITYFEGLFPVRDPDSMRFSINYFTAIGLGVLTEITREDLKKITSALDTRGRSRSVSSHSSYSSSRSRSFSRSPARSDYSTKSYSRSPPKRNFSRTPSRTPSRSPVQNRSRSPSRGRANTTAYSRDPSRSPPRYRSYEEKRPRERSESPRYRSNYNRRYNNERSYSGGYGESRREGGRA